MKGPTIDKREADMLVEALRRMSPRLDMLDCEYVLQAADIIEYVVRQNHTASS